MSFQFEFKIDENDNNSSKNENENENNSSSTRDNNNSSTRDSIETRDNNEKSTRDNNDNNDITSQIQCTPQIQCEKVSFSLLDQFKNIQFLEFEKLSTSGNHIFKRTMEDVKIHLALEDEFDLFNNPSDIIPFVYEGGLKTWECSLDLVSFLFKNQHLAQGKSIIELGCGSALPGITAFTTSLASSLILQDYNHQVLALVSAPNCLLNTTWKPDLESLGDQNYGHQEITQTQGSHFENVSFYSGPWSDQLADMIVQSHGKQDLILTSETIYNKLTVPHLLSVIKSIINQETGICLVAAKSVYFGCSGSVQDFITTAQIQFGFHVSTVFTHQTGIKRQILLLSL